MSFDIIVRGGLVFDGLGGEPCEADVGVVGDSIAAVAPSLPVGASRVIEARGLAVAPGFVDIHAHGDIYPLLCPDSPARLHDGVTTEIVGNCGESPFPQTDATLAARADTVERHGIAVDWRTLDDFARRQDADGSAINRGSLVGHGQVRAAVMGEGDRAPTASELDAMRAEVSAALDAGAWGFSTGLIYAPGMYAAAAEIGALCEVVVRYGGVYASHIRSEGEGVEEAVAEFVGVGRRTGVRLQLSHVKVSGRANWAKIGRVIQQIEAARAEGIDLACDRYPYTASATSLSAFLPGWAREGGREEMVGRLGVPAMRERLLAVLRSRESDATWRALVIAEARADAWRHAEGRSLLAVAAAAGAEPAEVMLDILAASGGRTSIVSFSMSEENLVTWLRLPYVAIGSDSATRAAEGPTADGKPHPRSYGTSARFLGRYVREQRLVPLAEGIRRLTSLPASRVGLRRRGVLRQGAFADVTVFDPDAIEDKATYEHPQQYSAGVRTVLVNGAVALDDGELTGVRNGRFLRRSISAK